MESTLSPARFAEIQEALKSVIDPEIGINVVDLGLIYYLGWDDKNNALVIHMTLTTAEWSLTDVLTEQATRALNGVVNQFNIDRVWMPPGGVDKVTEDGREMMSALGFTI